MRLLLRSVVVEVDLENVTGLPPSARLAMPGPWQRNSFLPSICEIRDRF